jgi:5-methylcytosine-specific restriction protein A
MFTIITENDISQWNDETGIKYHFPSRYLKFLTPGTKVIYYKGRLTDKNYKNSRLSSDPHYFGYGEIGNVEKEANGNSYYASIRNFVLFKKPVPFKINNTPIELIPTNLQTNYWRNGVRPANEQIFKKILQFVSINSSNTKLNDQHENDLVSVETDGGKRKIYTTVYERNRKLRDRAILLHGYTCAACDFNFHETYGEWGEGYIHVHHLKPISSSEEKVEVDPKRDLAVVCANCHSMIHRRKDKLLSIAQLRQLINAPKR